MAFFKKLKRDIGLEDGPEKRNDEKTESKLKEDDGAQQSLTENERMNEEKNERKPNEPAPPASLSEALRAGKGKNKINEVSVASPKNPSPDWLKTKEGQLAVDVYQTESEFCVQAPIAGVEPKNISIAVENDMLIIRGEREQPDTDKEKEYFYQECYWGPFSRQIILPEDADTQHIKAQLKKGVLGVRIPKIKLDHKQIKIEVDD